jgi:hypothetical protein
MQSKFMYGCLGVGIIGCIITGFLLVYGVGVANKETRLAVAIKAKQTDNTNEMDGMWKKISQAAEVTQGQKDALIEIFTGYAKARSPDKQGGTLATWIHESCPNVDTSTFNNLQNLIVASRDSWTMRQKELIDLNREHDVLLGVFPSNIVCSLLGRQKIDIVVVTSSRTEKAFATGKDDDTSVFPQKR